MKTSTKTNKNQNLTEAQLKVLNAIMNCDSYSEEGDAVWLYEIDGDVLKEAVKERVWEKMAKDGYIEITLDPDANESFIEITKAAYELYNETMKNNISVMTLTDMELVVLKAITNSDFYEEDNAAVWDYSVLDHLPFKGKVRSGVISSLEQKELLKVSKKLKGDIAGVFQMTVTGFALLNEYLAKEQKSIAPVLKRKTNKKSEVKHKSESKFTEKFVSISEKPSQKSKSNVDWSTFSYQQLAKEFGKDFVGKSKQQLIDLLSK
jgi:hypothetical protein